MIRTLRAEFRKLFSIRSTYLLLVLGVGLVTLFAFYGEGIKYKPENNNPLYLQNEIINAVGALSLFISLLGVLLVTHEYRFNTIMYTLTANKSRTKVFLAKLLAPSVVALVLLACYGALSPLAAALGIHIQGESLMHQHFYFHDIVPRLALYAWGYTMYGLILAFTIRNQIGAIVSLFLTQATIEPLLGIVLKSNQQYLPFNAINKLTSIQIDGPPVSYSRPAITVAVYIAVGVVISWILFLRRDAN